MMALCKCNDNVCYDKEGDGVSSVKLASVLIVRRLGDYLIGPLGRVEAVPEHVLCHILAIH